MSLHRPPEISKELANSRLMRAAKVVQFVSPIEKQLFSAVEAIYGEHGFVGLMPYDTEATRHREAPVLYWIAQTWLLDWPVDFASVVMHPHDFRVAVLAVECDGFPFHERTKEQAAKDRSRDRWLQAAGYWIYRFTGSEIFTAPRRCADDILAWAAQTRKAFETDDQKWLRREREPF